MIAYNEELLGDRLPEDKSMEHMNSVYHFITGLIFLGMILANWTSVLEYDIRPIIILVVFFSFANIINNYCLVNHKYYTKVANFLTLCMTLSLIGLMTCLTSSLTFKQIYAKYYGTMFLYCVFYGMYILYICIKFIHNYKIKDVTPNKFEDIL